MAESEKKTESKKPEAPKAKPAPPPPAPKKDDGKWKELGFRSQAAYQKFLDKGL
tara:strand:- start:116 stop:277 length:162 start_codon:yes stop_codon:yes gene_type:complete